MQGFLSTPLSALGSYDAISLKGECISFPDERHEIPTIDDLSASIVPKSFRKL